MKKSTLYVLGILLLSLVLMGCREPFGANSEQYGPITITFSTGDGTGTAPASIIAEAGDTITLPDQGDMIAPKGKIFVGWSNNNSEIRQNPGASVTISGGGKYTFTARWEDDEVFTITFDVGEGSGTAPESITAEYGDDSVTITFPDQGDMIAPEGTRFVGWYEDKTSYPNSKIYKPGESITVGPGDKTYYAQWKADCTVTYDMGSGTGTPPTAITVPYGTSITLPGPSAPEGKKFDRWRRSGYDSYEAGESFTVTADCTLTAEWINKTYAKEGIYVSLISFAGSAYVESSDSRPFVFLNEEGKDNLSYYLSSYYSGSSGSSNALFYAAHKALANLTANEDEFLSEISSVNVITFTDGMDNASHGASINPIEGQREIASNDYAEYVHDEIGKRKINGTSITAYSVGITGSGVNREYLGNLASSDGNVKEITAISELKAVFSDIAESMTVPTHFSMTTTKNDPGTVIRMTFDETSNAEASSKYIEGTLAYASGIYTLTDVKYEGGITSEVSTGGSITGTISPGSNIDFMFRNISGYDDSAAIQQWTKSPAGLSTWQKTVGYSASGATSTSAILIQLVLDASTSSDTQIRDAANNFIDILYNRVYN